MAANKVPIAKFPMEEVTVLAAEPIPNGATRTYSSIFPVGKGAGETWDRIRLVFHLTVTAPAPWAAAVESGVFNYIRRLYLETSDGDVICDVPGTGLALFNWYNDGHNPWHTPVGGAGGIVAAGTYDAVVDIPFGFRFLRKPEDGYLDSGAYSSIRLTITTGPFAPAVNSDLGTPGAGCAQAATFDLSIIRTKAGMINSAEVKPLFIPYIKYIGSRVPSNANMFFDIESSNDLALFGFMLANATVARQPFDHVVAATGLTAEADGLTSVTFGDNINPILLNNKLPDSFRYERHRDLKTTWPWSIPVIPNIATMTEIGKYIHNFVPDGSIYGAYPTGNKSQVRVSWTGGGAGTDQVDCLVWGFRRKRSLT